jgi:nucleotide-binding universal stress UspA family protein
MTAGIVVGVDDSVGARAALRWALREGARRHVTVTVLHAYHLDIAWIDRGDIERWTTMEQHSAEITLGHVLEDVTAPPACDLQACVVDGLPAEVLIAASETAAMLVVGARGRGRMTGLLFGSVSQRCVERARCPVVVVPTAREVAPRDELGPSAVGAALWRAPS